MDDGIVDLSNYFENLSNISYFKVRPMTLGEKRNKLKIRADRVQFLSSNKSEASEDTKNNQNRSVDNLDKDSSDDDLIVPF